MDHKKFRKFVKKPFPFKPKEWEEIKKQSKARKKIEDYLELKKQRTYGNGLFDEE